MSTAPLPRAAAKESSFGNPWLLLFGAYLATGSVLISLQIPLAWDTSARVLLLVLGLLLAGGAIVLRPSSSRVLFSSAFVPFLAHWSMAEDWDTARLLLRILMVLALLGAFLASLSRNLQKAVVSMLAVVHFMAIVVAASLASPPGTDRPWLSVQLWAHLFRPYLEFIGLDVRYNFYTPDPAPMNVLWFRIQYADGKAVWGKIPNRADCWTDLEFTRAMAIPELPNGEAPVPDNFSRLFRLRENAGENHDPPIPVPNLDPSEQYSEPSASSKLYLESFARHIALTFKHPTDPNQLAAGVKLYRVSHNVPTPKQVSEGFEPNDPTLYSATYVGEYGPDGKLKPTCYRIEMDDNGNPVREIRDPFLFWMIPIIREKDGSLTDFVKIHGDGHAGAKP
jgi:hypothetical protein